MNGVVCSAMHTGTWFVIRLLQVFGQGSVLPWRHSFEVGGGLPINWLHVHVTGPAEQDGPDPNRYLVEALVDAFVESGRYPVVLPVRDPVLSLITRHNRRLLKMNRVPLDQPMTRLVGAFEKLAVWHGQARPYMHWVPIDVSGDVGDRRAVLQKLCGFIAHTPDEAVLAAEAENWKPENTTAQDPSGLRAAYRAGDFDAVRDALPQELDQLLATPGLLTMYDRMGYELPWMAWSGIA